MKKILTPEERKPLPFKPEGLPEARNRYPLALEKVYNVGRVNMGLEPGPGLTRTNVFDFKVGLRLIISIEYAPLNADGEKGPFEHVCADLFNIDPRKVKPDESPFEMMIRHYHYMSRWKESKGYPVFKHMTEEGRFHLLFDRPDKIDDALTQLNLKDLPTDLNHE